MRPSYQSLINAFQQGIPAARAGAAAVPRPTAKVRTTATRSDFTAEAQILVASPVGRLGVGMADSGRFVDIVSDPAGVARRRACASRRSFHLGRESCMCALLTVCKAGPSVLVQPEPRPGRGKRAAVPV